MPRDVRLLVPKLYVLNTPPEVAESVATAVWTVEIGQDSVSWRVTETDNSGIEANIDVASMAAWFEHQGVPAVTPLSVVAVATHLMPDLINTALAV